ncbi:MAG: HPr family phosphocarrier protein [Acidobacteriota bacterium]|jgi:phosphotransferase system HPr (HPr) family protein
MIQTIVVIENELGLHARAAARLVRLTSRYESNIKLSRVGLDQHIDAKSILGILLLAARKGTRLQITFDGSDEAVAAREVVELFQTRFGEER